MGDGIMLSIGEDGIARAYDDTYDITIHCESREEQEEVRKALESIPRWIPCSERLPKRSGEYLVTRDIIRGYEPEACVIDYFEADTLDWDGYGNLVIAWMPKPEPYNASRNNH